MLLRLLLLKLYHNIHRYRRVKVIHSVVPVEVGPLSIPASIFSLKLLVIFKPNNLNLPIPIGGIGF